MPSRLWTAVLTFSLAACAAGHAAALPQNDWTILLGDKSLDAWKKSSPDWIIAGGVELDPKNPRLLRPLPGTGVFVNGPKGRLPDLLSKKDFGDLELHMEFCIPKGSNSGVKFHGLYEIQIFDSWHVRRPGGADCGGIYPRAELLPKYHHIDDGIPPLVNACKPPGQWQTLDAVFVAPRFNAAGKKIANARLTKVVLNGTVIHDNVELLTPTGNNYTKAEMATGPLLLQADHGPVAFRNVRVK